MPDRVKSVILSTLTTNSVCSYGESPDLGEAPIGLMGRWVTGFHMTYRLQAGSRPLTTGSRARNNAPTTLLGPYRHTPDSAPGPCRAKIA